MDRALIHHPYWELTAMLSGSITLSGAVPIELRAHSVCLIPPGYRHGEHTEDKAETIWIGFREQRRLPALTRKRPVEVESKPLTELAEQLWLFTATTRGPIGPELDAQLANILHRLLRLASEGLREPANDSIQRAVEYLINHYAEELHMNDVAQRFGFSTGYFHRQFRKRTGLPPNAFLTRIRLQVASQLLRETELPVKEIALCVGLPDEAYFSRRFKLFIGLSPVASRAKYASQR